MNIETISKVNKWLNATSYVALTTGVISILWTAKIASETWASITIGLIVMGLLSLIISWTIGKRNSINISIEEILRLIINSEGEDYLSKETKELNYLGNWITLKNGKKYEISRRHILELAHKLDENQIEMESSKDKFYNASPIEVLKELIKLGT